jgi:hypothetical protein
MVQVSASNVPTSKRKEPSLSPTTLKKRRVLEERSQNIKTPVPARGMKSSQNIKSSFEEDLNRLTQEIGEVGDSTLPMIADIAPFETDQKWARPAVKPFDPQTDALSILPRKQLT